eukprot:9114299-Lingulodinium_polyedra.AAC.1
MIATKTAKSSNTAMWRESGLLDQAKARRGSSARVAKANQLAAAGTCPPRHSHPPNTTLSWPAE